MIMRIEYRLASPEDLNEIYHMVQDAINYMIKQNIFQWDEIYPDKAILQEDIDKKQLYLGILENKPAVIYVLNREFDEEYRNGNWKYAEKPFYVVHRLCVNPLFQQKGIGRMTMLHIEETVRSMGFQAIRLDAFTENPFALKLYKNLGYTITGHAHWRKGKFCLMEKYL